MAVLTNGGIASAATTSSASTSPLAPVAGTFTGASGSQPARTWARASSSGTTAATLGRLPARGAMRSDDAPAAHHVGEEVAELGREVVAIQRQLDGGAQIVELLADVEAPLVEHEAVHRLLGEQDGDGVGELDLAAHTRLGAVDGVEDLAGEQVAAHDGEVGGRV